MMNSGVNRFILSFIRPLKCNRPLSMNNKACAIIFVGQTHKYTRSGAIGLGLSNANVCIGRCFSKEITATRNRPDEDFLLQNLTSAGSASGVLDIVGSHHTVMNSRHLLQALQSLFKLQKSSGNNRSQETILERPEFLALCKRFKNQARGIELRDTIQALKILSFLGVPSSNVLVQALLQLIRHNVNDLSLNQIVFLEFLLTRMENCPIVYALQTALPLVFEAQLSVKLDHTNLLNLSEILLYVTRKREISAKSVETVVASLTSLTNNRELDPRMAKSIVWALCNNNKPVDVEVLLQKSLKVMAESIEENTFKEIDTILRRLTIRILKRHMEFYHEDFFEKCSFYVINKGCGNIQNEIGILKKLSQIGYTSFDLLNFLNEKIVADPTLLSECHPMVLMTLISSFSNADYKPANWQVTCDLILNNYLLKEETLEFPWLKLAIDLAALGCFNSTLLERLFHEDFLQKMITKKNNTIDLLQVLTLHQAVVTLYSSYKGPLPSSDILEKAMTSDKRKIVDHFPLEAALVRGLGGPDYVQTQLSTRLGHFVDHVIIMRKGGFPTAVNVPADANDSQVLIEELEIPDNSQIVAVVALHASYYSRNCSRLRPYMRLVLRSLEALNLAVVVPISLPVWTDLPEQERIPYLMQEIKLKSIASEQALAGSKTTVTQMT